MVKLNAGNSEKRLDKICGKCEYFQTKEGAYNTKLEPDCIMDEDVNSEEYCEYFLRKGR